MAAGSGTRGKASLLSYLQWAEMMLGEPLAVGAWPVWPDWFQEEVCFLGGK